MPSRPYYLRTCGLSTPFGIAAHPLELSWSVSAPHSTNVTQSAYEIQLSSCHSFDAENIIWYTGKVSTKDGSSPSTIYTGDKLKSSSRYYWRVRIWDQNQEPSDNTWDTSERSWFETGILRPSDWKATWISVARIGASPGDEPIYLSKRFQICENVVRGRAYTTACGWYKLFINGTNLTGSALVPRWTPFHKFIEYQTYDITQHLRKGKNAISIAVADGRFRGQIGITEGRCRYGDRLAALLQLTIVTDDGRTDVICTDETWQTSTGPIRRSDPQWGEHVDFRISDQEWLGECDVKSCKVNTPPAERVSVSTMELVPEETERVEEVSRLRGRSITHLPSKAQIIDFGQNFAGIMRIKLRGLPGSIITITYSEVLTRYGELDRNYLKLPFFSNVPQQDIITLGDNPIDFQPWFAIHGFRYAEVRGLDYELNVDDIEGIVLASNIPAVGSFTCSEPRLNQLYQNILWGARSNFTDTATDCPTRERMGWTGDIQVFSPAATVLFDSQNFLRRYLRCLAAEQHADGTIPPYIPSGASAFSGPPGLMARLFSQSTGWGDTSIMIPWTLYQYYGDVMVLKRQYQSLKRWVECIERRARDKMSWKRWISSRVGAGIGDLERYILDTGWNYGEWLRAGSGIPAMLRDMLFPSASVSTAYLANSARLLSNISELLEKHQDAEYYQTLCEKTCDAWRAAFVRRDGSRIGNDYQDDYVRALAFELIEPNQRPAAVERLVELIAQDGYHLGTGFMSTGLLLPTLAANGRADIGYRILMQNTVPSWLYQVEKGATTLWETWEGYDSKGNAKMSHNHYAFGTVALWLQEGVAGLKALEPGYRRIRIEPLIGGGLTHAAASLKTPLGLAKSEWSLDKESGMVKLEVVIPPCSTAEIVLSGSRVVDVGSGTYSFEYEWEGT